jgi:ammonia channel protein AmtB
VKELDFIVDRYPEMKDSLMRYIKETDEEYYCHNNLYVALGTLFLWVAWFFFNGGTAFTLFEPRKNNPPKIMMNTTIAGAIAGLVAVILRP